MKPPVWHLDSIAQCVERLQSDGERGLSLHEAERRLTQYGKNRLPEEARIHPFRRFLAQFSDFMVLVLLGAGIVSFFLGEVVDGMAIVAILLVNALFGFLQEYRAERSLQALQRLTAPTSIVVRDGSPTKISADRLVPGDVLLIENGDRIPADGRLLWSMALAVDESLLTGESVPVSKEAQYTGSPDQAIADQKNMLFMGTAVTRGRARMLVTGTGLHTQIGDIAALMRSTQSDATPLQKRLEQLGKRLVVICFVLVGLVFIAGIARGLPMYRMFLTGVSLAVAAIPEGLPAVVTAALAIGVQRMIRRNAIVRRLPAVETLGCTTIICTDKTGTLTKNEMTLTRLFVPGREVDVSGTGYAPIGDFKEAGRLVHPRDDADLRLALEIAVMCNSATVSDGRRRAGAVRSLPSSAWRVIGDPTEGALLVAGLKAGIERQQLQQTVRTEIEHPFDPQRRRMSVVVQKDGRRLSYVKGAPGPLLQLCTHVRVNGRIRTMTPVLRRQIEERVTQYASQALRVMAFGYRDVVGTVPSVEVCEQELVFVGLAALFDPPREDVRRAIQLSRRAGIRTIMLTGDHPATAVAIGKLIGLQTANEDVVTGQELDDMTDRQLSTCLENTSCFARVSPRHKLRLVQTLRKRGEIVAMTGDGVNDAPAVKEADIGISMGRTGADVTKEASDIVLADDNYSSIVAAVEEGRAIYDNIRKFIRYLLGCNAGEVMAMLVALLAGLPLPLLPLQLLWMNLVTDGLPAIALGIDPVDKEIMRRRPRLASESIFARGLWKRILVSGMTIGSSTLLAFAMCLWIRPDEIEWARTIAFTTLVVSQLFYSFQCRSEYRSAVEAGIFANRYLVFAVFCSFAMQIAVVYWLPLAATFRTVPLSAVDWGVVMLFSGWGYLAEWLLRTVRTHFLHRFTWVRVSS